MNQAEPVDSVISGAMVRRGTCLEPQPDSCGLALFGASGDLSRRKLYPALYALFRKERLPENWYVLGLGRSGIDDSAFRKILRESVGASLQDGPPPPGTWESFAGHFHFSTLGSDRPEDFRVLQKRMAELDGAHATKGNRLFYLATPPDLFPEIVHHLGTSGLNRSPSGHGWVRMVIEKPFGRDLPSARALYHKVGEVFDESQVYRIDHFLGKETVQNILFLRFANTIFEPIWNRRYIDHIQITADETLGVEGRAGYYDRAGALRDMFQNHLFQLLCLVGMEPPAGFEAESIRDEKSKVLRSVRPLDPGETDLFAVRGQYGRGRVNGESVVAYREEPGVAPDSRTETFAALKLYIDNWRWQGVPFYLRSGKRMTRKGTEISIEFKAVPHLFFKPLMAEAIEPNNLLIRVQPQEGISLTFQAKYPGPKLAMAGVTMDFNYRGSFQMPPPEAYERLLLDCLAGDPTHFSREDWVEQSWSLLTPILQSWSENPPKDFPNYPAGTSGPQDAHALIERDGRRWKFG